MRAAIKSLTKKGISHKGFMETGGMVKASSTIEREVASARGSKILPMALTWLSLLARKPSSQSEISIMERVHRRVQPSVVRVQLWLPIDIRTANTTDTATLNSEMPLDIVKRSFSQRF